MSFSLNSPKWPPNWRFYFHSYFSMASNPQLFSVATAQDQNKGMVVVGFSSTTLSPGAQTCLTLRFLVPLHSLWPGKWPHTTHQAYQITSHNYPLFKSLGLFICKIQVETRWLFTLFLFSFCSWLGINLALHILEHKIASSHGAPSAFPLVVIKHSLRLAQKVHLAPVHALQF